MNHPGNLGNLYPECRIKNSSIFQQKPRDSNLLDFSKNMNDNLKGSRSN